MYEELRKFLESKGITTTHSHSSSGEDILQLPNDISLMIMVEVYDQNHGWHETVKLGEVPETIAKLAEEVKREL